MMRCVSVFGPTASGKSGLALLLAKEFNGVIISADSMQIYRRMDIGTAKPTVEEQKLVPHKMIDICNPNDPFSVWEYKKMAEEEIENALALGKLPIVVGGTGLYLDALFFNTDFGSFEVDPAIRLELNRRIEHGEAGVLLEELMKIDPDSGKNLHEKDHKRIVRALEVFLSTGKTLTHYKNESHKTKSRFDFLKINLIYQNRDMLYQRINSRVDQMVEQGLIDEIKSLRSDGTLSSGTASQAIGYKEFFPYLDGRASLVECVDLLKQKTRNYAKRQITWFKRYDDVVKIIMDRDHDPFEKARMHIKNFLEE